MHQVYFSGADVVLHDLLRGVQKELLAGRALKIAVDFDDHGSCLGAEGLGWVDVRNAIYGDAGCGDGWRLRRFRDCGFLRRRRGCLRLLVRRRREQQSAKGDQGKNAGRDNWKTAIHRFLQKKAAGSEFQPRVSQVEMAEP
jgi:hypothetical protein